MKKSQHVSRLPTPCFVAVSTQQLTDYRITACMPYEEYGRMYTFGGDFLLRSQCCRGLTQAAGV